MAASQSQANRVAARLTPIVVASGAPENCGSDGPGERIAICIAMEHAQPLASQSPIPSRKSSDDYYLHSLQLDRHISDISLTNMQDFHPHHSVESRADKNRWR